MFGRSAAMRYEGFADPQVVPQPASSTTRSCIVLAVGMTFVILTGGIDLSVGSVVALSDDDRRASCCRPAGRRAGDRRWCCSIGSLGTPHGPGDPLLRHPAVHRDAGGHVPGPRPLLRDQRRVDPDHRRRSPPSPQTRDPPAGQLLITPIGGHRPRQSSPSPRACCTTPASAAPSTPIGGSEQSAMLMGLPVARTKVAVYVISGFCAGARRPAVHPLHAVGLQPARASAWSSTRSPRSSSAAPCSPAGAASCSARCSACWCSALIQTIISFEGTLSSWWTKIFIGALLLVFVVLQRIFVRRPA